MDYRLIVPRPWRYRDHKRNYKVLEPGEYHVPEHITEEIADLAVGQGMAVKIKIYMPVNAEPVKEKPKRGRPRKLPAPDNKAMRVAPENKSPFH